jgi:lipid-binding SYLF domain-containing protein
MGATDLEFTRRAFAVSTLALAGAAGPFALLPAFADDREKLVANAREALSELKQSEPRSRRFARDARASLVFPSILKAGFVFGGETGNGVLFEGDKPVGFFNLSGGSWGLQIGGQDFAYALFFMTPGSLSYLRKIEGWQVGTGPSITVVNKGAAAEADSTTLTHDVYAFPFNGKGLMADLTLQGTKISRIHPK